MLSLLLNAWLVLALPGQDSVSQKAGPTPEQVAQATTELDAALRSRDSKALDKALQAAQAVPHSEVVRRVVRALEDEREEVRLAAIQSLRWLNHPDAVHALHRAAKDRKLMKAPTVAAALLRSIGQHADPSSIDILARDPFDPMEQDCIRARIYGLGRIRTKESIEALLGILSLTGTGAPSGERMVKPWMDEMRLSLMVLTGVDQGKSPELWERWWRESRKGFQIQATVPELPKDVREIWDDFWGLPREYERERRREDRGEEPPSPRKE